MGCVNSSHSNKHQNGVAGEGKGKGGKKVRRKRKKRADGDVSSRRHSVSQTQTSEQQGGGLIAIQEPVKDEPATVEPVANPLAASRSTVVSFSEDREGEARKASTAALVGKGADSSHSSSNHVSAENSGDSTRVRPRRVQPRRNTPRAKIPKPKAKWMREWLDAGSHNDLLDPQDITEQVRRETALFLTQSLAYQSVEEGQLGSSNNTSTSVNSNSHKTATEGTRANTSANGAGTGTSSLSEANAVRRASASCSTLESGKLNQSSSTPLATPRGEPNVNPFPEPADPSMVSRQGTTSYLESGPGSPPRPPPAAHSQSPQGDDGRRGIEAVAHPKPNSAFHVVSPTGRSAPMRLPSQ